MPRTHPPRYDAAPDRRDLAALYQLGMPGYDPVRREWIGAVPREHRTRWQRNAPASEGLRASMTRTIGSAANAISKFVRRR